MTEQEIMQLAEEAGFGVGEHNGEVHVLTPVYEDLSIAEYVLRFATIVAEREREACAKLVERMSNSNEGDVLAAAIRTHSQEGGAAC